MGQIFSNGLEQVSPISMATMKLIMKQNAVLQEKIVEAKLEQSSEKERNRVLKSVMQDAVQENKALQNELERVISQNADASKFEGRKRVRKEKHITPEDKGLDDGNAEIDKVFEKAEEEIALISDKIRDLHEQCEGLEKCDWFKARIRNHKINQLNFRKLQDEIRRVKAQKEIVQERFERFRPIQEEHFDKMRAENNALVTENLQLERQTDGLMRKMARESRYSKMMESEMIKRQAFEEENRQKKKRLRDLTRKYDDLKRSEFESKEKVMRVEELKMENNWLQQRIDQMETKYIDLKTDDMVFMYIDNEEATALALNKKLLKRKQKLEKELQEFGNYEANTQEMKHGMSELKNENCNLYKDVVALEVQIKRTQLQKTHWKSVQKEEKSLKLSNKSLKLEIEKLNKVLKTEIVNMYTIPNNELEDKLNVAQQINDDLHAQYEDAFVLANKPDNLEMRYRQLQWKLMALKEFNYKYALEINELKETANGEAGPSTSR